MLARGRGESVNSLVAIIIPIPRDILNVATARSSTKASTLLSFWYGDTATTVLYHAEYVIATTIASIDYALRIKHTEIHREHMSVSIMLQ